MDKIKICIDHINEIFDHEDVAVDVDFGTLHVVADQGECDLRDPIAFEYGDEDGHITEPITNDHLYRLYQI